jgi:hypothetical protein
MKICVFKESLISYIKVFSFEPESCICTFYFTSNSSIKNTGKIFGRNIQNFKQIFGKFVRKICVFISKVLYLTDEVFFLNHNRAFAHLKSDSSIKNTRKIFWPYDPKF